MEPLEQRVMLHADVLPMVILKTNFGDIPIELLENDAPGTVDNFLTYISDGDYVNSIFHRLVPGFVLQGGGFSSQSETVCPGTPCTSQNVNASLFAEIPTNPPIVNEFKVSNVRGTVAMAKLPTGPDTATNQFFVNLGNNGGNLDNQNGGFTVFGRVMNMTSVDLIATFARANFSSAFPPGSRLTALNEVPINGNRIPLVQSVTGDAVIHGSVYLDNNGNGNLDGTEMGMADRFVFIDANRNGTFDGGEVFTRTASDGSFHFRVAPGDYVIRTGSAAGFERTLVTGQYDVAMQLGRSINHIDFGLKYIGTSWTNPLHELDVDAVSGVTPRDALLIINEVRLRSVSDTNGQLPMLTTAPDAPVFYDTNRDGFVTPSDALLVINDLALSGSDSAEQASSFTVFADSSEDLSGINAMRLSPNVVMPPAGLATIHSVDLESTVDSLPPVVVISPQATLGGITQNEDTSHRASRRLQIPLAVDAAMAELDAEF